MNKGKNELVCLKPRKHCETQGNKENHTVDRKRKTSKEKHYGFDPGGYGHCTRRQNLQHEVLWLCH